MEPMNVPPTMQRLCCLHIGIPKAASKTLQGTLFSGHPEIYYMGMYSDWKRKLRYRTHIPGVTVRDEEMAELLNELLWDKRDSPDLDRSRAIHAKRIQPALDKNLAPVWSWESMIEDLPEVQEMRARNLHAVFGQCKVIVVIRNPIDMIKSLYLQLLWRDNLGGRAVRGRPPCSLPFDEWLDEHWQTQGEAPRAHLQYAEAIEIFANVFGRKNVGVFLFEQLQEDSESFIHSLCHFMMVDSDYGVQVMGEKNLHLRWRQSELNALAKVQQSRIRSTLFQYSGRRIRKIMLGVKNDRSRSILEPARVLMSKRSLSRIVEKTRSGNRRLAGFWDLPLEKYGYPL